MIYAGKFYKKTQMRGEDECLFSKFHRIFLRKSRKIFFPTRKKLSITKIGGYKDRNKPFIQTDKRDFSENHFREIAEHFL